MKKRILTIILALSLVALLAALLVACDPADGGGGDDGGIRDFEVGKYTVTFNTNTDLGITISPITDVLYGTKISAPTTSVYKTGYEFDCWSQDGKNEFKFDETPITANITLTALYNAKVYAHTAELEKKLTSTFDEETGKWTFSVDEEEREVGDIGLAAGAKLETTYNVTDSLPIPTAADGTKFCFWYYMDGDKPVQFTRWREDDKATVDLLSKYTQTKKLVLYPMFEDNLPQVTVKYADSITGASYDQYEQGVSFGKTLGLSDMPTGLSKENYSFDYWYYNEKVTDKNGVTTTNKVEFVFDDDSEKATSPKSAAHADDNFTPVTLTLYAKWTKEIRIRFVEDFEEIYNLLRIENPSTDQKAEIERILGANISITSDINFGDAAFEPLFDSAHIFKGTIDGGVYNQSTNVVTGRATLRGGVFGSATEASVFGYSDGTITNLKFVNIGLSIAAKDDKYADTVNIGTVTTQNRGLIHNCEVMSTGIALSDLHTVVFGGVTAINRVTDDIKGTITSCVVTLDAFSAECEALTFGGVAGTSNPSTKISKCTVAKAKITSVVCRDDNISSNGRSSLTLGGLVGNNSGSIMLSIVAEFDALKVESLTEFYFGGVAGVNTGSVRTTHATSTLCSLSAPAKVMGSLSHPVGIGGLVGKNEGFAVNSYCDIKAYAQVDATSSSGSTILVGGIMGNNYSEKKDTSTTSESGIGAINHCYATGEISVNVDKSVNNVTVYAGGIAGRNSHSKLGSMFTAVNISVSNEGNAGGNKLGYLFGAMENKSTVNKNCYYVEDTELTLNGVDYERVQGDGDEYTESFPITSVGAELKKAQFKTSTLLTTLGFNGETWRVDAEYDYPILDNSLYN